MLVPVRENHLGTRGVILAPIASRAAHLVMEERRTTNDGYCVDDGRSILAPLSWSGTKMSIGLPNDALESLVSKTVNIF